MKSGVIRGAAAEIHSAAHEANEQPVDNWVGNGIAGKIPLAIPDGSLFRRRGAAVRPTNAKTVSHLQVEGSSRVGQTTAAVSYTHLTLPTNREV